MQRARGHVSSCLSLGEHLLAVLLCVAMLPLVRDSWLLLVDLHYRAGKHNTLWDLRICFSHVSLSELVFFPQRLTPRNLFLTIKELQGTWGLPLRALISLKSQLFQFNHNKQCCSKRGKIGSKPLREEQWSKQLHEKLYNNTNNERNNDWIFVFLSIWMFGYSRIIFLMWYSRVWIDESQSSHTENIPLECSSCISLRQEAPHYRREDGEEAEARGVKRNHR